MRLMAATQSMGLRNSRMWWPLSVRLESVSVVLLLIPPFFRTFLPQATAAILGITLAVLLLLFASVSRSHSAGNGSEGRSLVLLGVFFCFVLVNSNMDLAEGSNYLWLVQFGGTLVAMVLLYFGGSWQWTKVALYAIGFFGLFYSTATILFWLVPDAYGVVYPFFQAKSDATITGMGYRAGLTTHYSTNGMYVALGFLACSSIALCDRSRRWVVFACLCLFALVLTTKRAHLAFGVASCAIAYFVLNSRNKLGTFGKFIAATSVSLLVLYVASFFNEEILMVIDRFQSMENDDTFGGRSGFYNLCLSMWNGSPLIGSGWGSYTLEFNKTAEGAWYVANGFTTMDAHNVYLQVLAEEGLVGFLLFVGAMAIGLATTVRSLVLLNAAEERDAHAWDRRALLAGSLSVQLFFAMYCLTGNPLYDAQMYVPWIIALGVSAVLSRGVGEGLSMVRRGCRRSIVTESGR